ncbi:hypothetical protein [Massilia agri]|uniref:Uncharacterized protein n=1 Tax=Massilia agri TaxID=1886785 RepID=A0ABT2AJT1_9BURK|nr:hypothetical protein [Massilia agri]MCS0596492.1 hypothetical protein [Massilia agri]
MTGALQVCAPALSLSSGTIRMVRDGLSICGVNMAASLDAQLPYPLSSTLANAIEALEAESFGERIRAANRIRAASV